MDMRWNTFGFCLRISICLISVWGIRDCWSINDEGLALLAFQGRITLDPFNALGNWNPNDNDPCKWVGVHCVNGKVQGLELKGLSLGGTLAPELGKLNHLTSLVLCKNNFSGVIPKELGDLPKLDLLDLRENNLSGDIPEQIGKLSLLKNFVWQRNFKVWNKSDSLITLPRATLVRYVNAFTWPLFKLGKSASDGHEQDYCDILPNYNVPKTAQNVLELVGSRSPRRKLLQTSGNNNLAAAPFSDKPTIEFSTIPITFSSGAFPAVPDTNKNQYQSPAISDLPDAPDDNAPDKNQSHTSDENQTSQDVNNAAKVICPWKSGISGQLRKAFITGVPKLNRAELETACEDFSNIVVSEYEECTIYKGTLSNGVEIAVVSTLITSSQDWSKHMEMKYRNKIDTLSRINHKNFVNLIGFCEEEEPFTRMLVFEYAPNGNVFEHIHVEDMESLDWGARVRIIMGVAYCLQYMHHDLNPPVAQSKVSSKRVFLTDDFAAKVAEVTFKQIVSTNETTGDSKKSGGSSQEDLETNVYDFGLLLLEIISGKVLYSEENGNLLDGASKYLNDQTSMKNLIDPTLKSFKENEFGAICEVIQECVQPDPKLRPSMRDVTSKLRGLLDVSPEQAVPRLSPLWWAELEILSVEAT
ncbi:unnamed protein product [Sphenostylis stenocarpa]|uniref:Protein kinase domain-containing protein n=1 Tax=Sphenostylis stenocarpa TaxID=92480 RepID=A0AA86SRA5_9FABA|nr:unnamed protein product [Sphenostylis stenocarpa]